METVCNAGSVSGGCNQDVLGWPGTGSVSPLRQQRSHVEEAEH